MSKLENLMRVARILKDARDIVAEKWTQGAYFKRSDGLPPTDSEIKALFLGVPDDDDGYHYCGDGALRRAVKNELRQWEETKRSRVEGMLHEAQKRLSIPIKKRIETSTRLTESWEAIWGDKGRSYNRIWCFNDFPDTTKETMLECYDEAIEEQCKLVQEEANRHPHPADDEQS